MRSNRSGPCLDALLYSGHRTLGELAEQEVIDAFWPYVGQPDKPPPERKRRSGLKSRSVFGALRKWRDTKCRCINPGGVIEWQGYNQPLEQWFWKCGRIMPRPYDAQFPLSEADRASAVPTAEVASFATPANTVLA